MTKYNYFTLTNTKEMAISREHTNPSITHQLYTTKITNHKRYNPIKWYIEENKHPNYHQKKKSNTEISKSHKKEILNLILTRKDNHK